MNKIKFRAWQKYHKKMVELTSISFDDNGEINGVATFVENQAPQRISYRDDLLGRFFLKDERGMVLELMQYTGLKDKNGVEIYGGDIFWSDHSGEYTYVEYQEGAFYIIHTVTSEKTLLSKEHTDWIIRGNIYENPELLEREGE